MSLLGKNEEKVAIKLEKYISEGLENLQKKMYNAALIGFSKAMELEPDQAYPKLLEAMEGVAQTGEYESALSIGLNLIKGKNKDYALVNKLGNYARKMGDFKQANSLYKAAYKINKNYKIAFYNLAASEVKANYYDDAVTQALSQFKDSKEFFLPGYAGGEAFFTNIENKLKESKAKKNEAKLQELQDAYQQKKASGDAVEAESINAEMEKFKQQGDVTPKEICHAFLKQQESGEGINTVATFDFCIYAVVNGLPDFATKLIPSLSEDEFPMLKLLQPIIIAQKGDNDASVKALTDLLGDDLFNRYYNINLGLLYRKMGKSFLSIKYLLRTAELLNKTDGIFDIQQVIKTADEEYDKGNNKKALEFYLVTVQELPDIQTWNKIGIIYKELKQIDEAIKAFREILRIDPKSEIGNSQLMAIHDYYVSQATDLLSENKNQPAADFYDRALMIFRLPTTLRGAADAYHRMNNIKMEKKLLRELEALENAKKEAEQERLRQALIMKGRKLVAQKKYQKAIEVLDSAFDMKLDKNLFSQLVKLYKAFKGKDSANHLAKRWSDMVVEKEREELRKRESEKGREESPKEEKEKT